MASIRKNTGKNGVSYNVQVRKKANGKVINVSASFGDEMTANLWGCLKEMCLDEPPAFGLSRESMLTLRDIVEAKYGNDMKELASCIQYFHQFLERFYVEITYDEWLERANLGLNSMVRKGGGKDPNSGKISKASPGGVLRKYAVLSSAVSHAISMGYNLDNVPLRVIAYLRTLIKGKGNDEEE